MPAYSGNSIVDYLSSTGADSSYSNRSKLYSSSGINMGSYTGTAQQNIALLNALRGGSATPASPAPAATTPTPSAPAPAPMAAPATMPTSRTDYVAKLGNELTAKDAEYAKSQQAAQDALIKYYAGLESSTDIYKRLRQEQGVDQQSELVNVLTKDVMSQQDLLDAIPDSVNERSGGFLMTEGDRVALQTREQQPVIEQLNKLLRNKQYEEIGLQGKTQLVSELLQLAINDQERGAKPYQLGVDFSTKERQTAMQLLSSIMSTQASAYSSDLSSFENKQLEDIKYQRQLQQDAVNFDQQKELAKLTSSLSLGNSMALKAEDKKKEAATQKTEDTWNSILGSAKTEYDVWNYIDKNQAKLQKEGVDINKLWSLHAALAGKVGVGSKVRTDSESSGYY